MSVPRRMPPSTNTSSLPARPAPPKAAVTSARTSSVGRAWSSCLPPWFEITMPSRPFWAANTASSPVCTPLSTSFILPAVTERSHARSFQLSRASVKVPRAPMTPPDMDGPVFWTRATLVLSWTLLRWSRSRRPMTLVSTVTRSAVRPAANTRWSMASVFARSGLTYTWYHCCCPGSLAPVISSRSRVAMLAMHWMMPALPAARARPTSAWGCAMPAMAEGEMKSGRLEGQPSSTQDTSTEDTSTITRGRSHNLEYASQFARFVTSSQAAEA
mmetsp:Transcript_86600/g.220631  ORF Transcript_86600/g.220631 Transcript_86600/m.220631 type:complete len:272 (+) Transcript_86600:229-1044(+)